MLFLDILTSMQWQAQIPMTRCWKRFSWLLVLTCHIVFRPWTNMTSATLTVRLWWLKASAVLFVSIVDVESSICFSPSLDGCASAIRASFECDRAYRLHVTCYLRWSVSTQNAKSYHMVCVHRRLFFNIILPIRTGWTWKKPNCTQPPHLGTISHMSRIPSAPVCSSLHAFVNLACSAKGSVWELLTRRWNLCFDSWQLQSEPWRFP